jgi:hypothetical protein
MNKNKIIPRFLLYIGHGILKTFGVLLGSFLIIFGLRMLLVDLHATRYGSWGELIFVGIYIFIFATILGILILTSIRDWVLSTWDLVCREVHQEEHENDYS